MGTPGVAVGVENRVRRYALCTAVGHHHHFVCRSCHTVLEVECEALERALAALGEETGLAIERHDVTLRGQCLRCREGVSA
jgi:Fur family ferric uptake transcriptional regulator